jgi:nickel-dependent lactate racemase
MQVHLAFGKTGISANLPPGFRYRVLETRTAAPLADPEDSIGSALDLPIGSPPLAEIARGKRTASISVCDITRPAPNRTTLPLVLRRLEQTGIQRHDITILIATGLHRAATQSEIQQICGEQIAAAYRVVNHNARALAEHRHLGSTVRGTPVYIDERFVASDLHITLGLIEPHLMLGYSGGRKLIAPGLAAQETIKVLHSPKFMRDPEAIEGSVSGNPLHHELLEIARMARHDFALEAVLAHNRSIAAVFAGQPEQAHRRGVEFVSNTTLETLDEPVDAVITSAAGHPLDLTFYQTIKGVTAASHIVKDGGRILVVGECSEGAGAPEFTRMLEGGRPDVDFLNSIDGAPVIVDQWQLEKLALVTARQQVFYFVPGLPGKYHANLWGTSCSSLEAAILALTAGLAPNSRIAIIPDGPYVLAKVPVGSSHALVS